MLLERRLATPSESCTSRSEDGTVRILMTRAGNTAWSNSRGQTLRQDDQWSGHIQVRYCGSDIGINHFAIKSILVEWLIPSTGTCPRNQRSTRQFWDWYVCGRMSVFPPPTTEHDPLTYNPVLAPQAEIGKVWGNMTYKRLRYAEQTAGTVCFSSLLGKMRCGEIDFQNSSRVLNSVRGALGLASIWWWVLSQVITGRSLRFIQGFPV